MLLQEANKMIGDHKMWLMDKSSLEYKTMTEKIYIKLLMPAIWYLEPIMPNACQVIQKGKFLSLPSFPSLHFGQHQSTFNIDSKNDKDNDWSGPHLFPRKILKNVSGVQTNAKVLLW